ncbi:hypothetical protein [Pseudomonas sp. GL-RE-20]|uniref:hypothetical protein n=1 Tax=Pseudomonas sp. GL-RE-20 TaxID=2832372 RepID=UPI001CBF107B|nr:hypothetical protein [Pseudomonas sp. GL-RE-20]
MGSMNSQEQLNLTRDIIMKQFHPEEFEAELAQKQKKIADLLAFVDGVVAAHNLQQEEQKLEKEKNILFRSEDFPPNKINHVKEIKKLFNSKK